MSETVKIYGLIDPRTSLVSYVGQTTLSLELRLRTHINSINSKKDKSKRKNWISHIIKSGLKITIELIDEVPKCDWEFWERHYIKLFKSCGAKLYNGTDGGNSKMTQKLFDSKKGQKQSPERSELSRKALILARLSPKFIKREKKPPTQKQLDSYVSAGLKRRTGEICQYDLRGNFMKEWSSLRDIKIEGKSKNIIQNITKSYLTLRRSAYGFYWRLGNKEYVGEKINIDFDRTHYLAKSVIRISEDGTEKCYISASEAARDNNIKNSDDILNVCYKKRNTCGGFKWKLKN